MQKKTDTHRREPGHVQHTAVGTIQDFLASALSLPTGIITVAFLTRRLGPESYGLFAVAVTIVAWIELIIEVCFTGTSVKFIAESDNWKTVAPKFVQIQFMVGLAAAGLLMLLAPYLAIWLKAAELSTYLRLFSLDIPIYALVCIHRSILIGRGLFSQRAFLSAVLWSGRMVLILIFVGLRPTVTAAIMASVATSIVLLSVARGFVKPAFIQRTKFPTRKIWGYAGPLFFYTVGVHLFNRIDLLFVKAQSGLPEIAGFYGAAKNLTIVPMLLAGSLSPLLLAKLTHMFKKSQTDEALNMVRDSMRFVICLLPFAGMSAGIANEVVTALYGDPFLPAGSFLALLIFAALGSTMISITCSSLTAAGRPMLTALFTCPIVIIASATYHFVIPRFGPIGAATVTASLAWMGAFAIMLVIYKLWGIYPPAVTILRSIIICTIAYYISSFWATPGILLLVKIVAVSLVIFLSFLLTGELKKAERNFVRAMLSRTNSIR
jgi:O-antigen/teichoic acid export membrane protein